MSTERLTREVTIIPATMGRFAQVPVENPLKKRVAAYARVSTDNDEQASSFKNQLDHYTSYIHSNPVWEFIEVYTDEGISGTSIKKREGFKRMIADAMDGRIDLILTKSVSRFARNTVDTLTTVRQLKDKGVEVFFEKENIYTLDSKGELLITIMSSLAQEESRSISSNVAWGQRKRFADGKVSLPYKHFLGYEKGPDDRPQIVEKEAIIVRLIYKLYLEGKTASAIAASLTRRRIPSPAGKETWQPTTIVSILTNEKYIGEAILQKRFCVDFLTKKMKANQGEIPQYHVENSHEPIISKEAFDLVQYEMQRRKEEGRHGSCKSCFSARIICGECGRPYGRKVWHSTDKYRRTIWQCNHKFKNDEKCQTPHLYEDSIKQSFVDAFNTVITNKDEILGTYQEMIGKLMDTTALEKERRKVEQELGASLTYLENFVARNAAIMQDQAEYLRQYNEYSAKYLEIKKRQADLNQRIELQRIRKNRIRTYIRTLSDRKDLLTEFDERLFTATVESINVHAAKAITFRFKDGTELTWTMA